MDMTGEYQIKAARIRVWNALNDIDVLRAAIPGCESIEKTSDSEFVAKVAARIGPVSARFGGKVTLSDLDPPRAYTISGEGQGGAAGFAKGGARVELEEIEGGAATLLRYKVEAMIGGKLAQIGSRLVAGATQKLADEFFTKFKAVVETPQVTIESGEAPVTAAETPPPAKARPEQFPLPAIQAERKGIPAYLWLAVISLILILFGLGLFAYTYFYIDR